MGGNIAVFPVKKFINYLSLVKFSHTVFALPFALIGFTLAVVYFHQPFKWELLVEMLLCMVFARSAAMSFNRYLDRHFDALNPRTAKREIPAGIISAKSALIFTIINSLLFIATTWFIGFKGFSLNAEPSSHVCFYLSFVALFVILFYSYTKRFTALCHLVLGVGLSLSPIGAFLAVTGFFACLPVLFSLAVVTWVSGFDIIYALQDEEFDRSQKLHSIPAAIGVKKALFLSTVLHFFSGAFIIAAGIYGHFNLIYWAGAAFYCTMLIYQHLLVKPSDLSKVNMAFANTNGFASVVFASFTIASLIA
jgi:4-hydroxybenzoate polyprenyltransferase